MIERKDAQLYFREDGTFHILQIADMHGSINDPVTRDVLSRAIRCHEPDLIVLTGDNFILSMINYTSISNAAKSFKELIGDIPYVMTFGNHDCEYNSTPIEHQYMGFGKFGALDYDCKEISDCGTGNLYIASADGTEILWDLVLINSGTYDPSGGYGKAGYNQVSRSRAAKAENEERYGEIVDWIVRHNDEQREMTADHSLLPTLAFQHIPLQEFYTTGILCPCAADDPEGFPSIPGLKEQGYYKPNWNNPTVKGVYAEKACASEASTLEQFLAMAREGNYRGLFYGHDHVNSLEGMGTLVYEGREYSLYQGYGWCANNEDYSPADKGARAFTLYADGHFETEVLLASQMP